ncbi:hypothetical protein [Streptomyces sp. S-9]|uniref:hypothetical protein n=1 Tax=Streptomyces sp. S-9 TaxID=2806600 RepID=UPI00193C2959|nr:hypothetical protein [Streptomyces sp. S-9]
MAMGADPSEDEVRAALDAQLARCRGKRGVRTSAYFHLDRLHLLDASVVRYVEKRTETTRDEPGDVDLDDRPVYDVLDDYQVDPRELRLRKSLDLVKRDTVSKRACGCGNGRRQCPACNGMTYRPCEPAQPCPVCAGVSPCTQYLGHGRTTRPPKARRPVRAEERVKCEACGTPDSACGGCQGWGKVRCPQCQGRGRVPCTTCTSTGTVECKTCRGRGALTSWAAGRITWTSETEKVPWPYPPPKRVTSQLNAGQWQENTLGPEDPLPDDLSPSHRSLVEQHLGTVKGEQDRTVVIRRLTVVRARPKGSGSMEYYIFKNVSGGLMVRPSMSDEGRRNTAAVLLATAVLLVLVLLLVN